MGVSAVEHAQASEYKNVFYADGGKLYCMFVKLLLTIPAIQFTITSCYKVLSEHEQINVDLINALTTANIPLEKVEKLKAFIFNKYCNQ
ncbi:12256_t:CDS:2, partial [Gigaspora rosea]